MAKESRPRLRGNDSAVPSPPPFPFRELELTGLGGRVHGPFPPPYAWNTVIPYFNFYFVIRGQGWLRCHGRTYAMEPGTCFLFAPGTQVTARSTSDEPYLNFALHFFPTPRRTIPPDALRLLFGRKAQRFSLLLELARHCSETCKRGDALGLQEARLAGQLMLAQLWREAYTPDPREEDERIRELLAEDGRTGARSVPELARQVGLSASQFTRRVRALTGVAPREHLIQERIGHACGLLSGSSRSVVEVAEMLGYNDPSYFVRQFQEVMKTTPARFRRQSAWRGEV